MKGYPQISIIMPVHNAGDYLEEAIESVKNQTFKNFELICVDDASDDCKTKKILTKYVKQEKTFSMKVLFLEKSAGAANARNTGFREAKGMYTIFLDADDIFSPDFLEKMHTRIEREKADVCICGYTEFFTEPDGKKAEGNTFLFVKDLILNNEREEWALNFSGVPWNKLCRTEFLCSNNIFFQDLSSSNDVFFAYMVMYRAEKISVIEESGLIYYRIKTKTQISANREPANFYYAVQLLQVKNRNYFDNNLFMIQTSAFLIWGMLSEISRCSLTFKNIEIYNMVKAFLGKEKLHFRNKILEKCRYNILQLPYESHWFDDYGSYWGQLNLLKDEIKEKLKGYNDVFLWGTGKRGEAFQKFCFAENICIKGVMDKKDSGIGNRTDQGYLIMGTDEISKYSGVIVASNSVIYQYLVSKSINYDVINLEEYCPI